MRILLIVILIISISILYYLYHKKSEENKDLRYTVDYLYGKIKLLNNEIKKLKKIK